MRLCAIIVPLLLGGCASTATTPAAVPAAPIPIPTVTRPAAGLDRVIGRDERALVTLFGKPDAELNEGTARKLQFASAICVLDAYLYPASGGGAPVVTYVDTRQPSGSPIDRASCVAALTRRGGAK